MSLPSFLFQVVLISLSGVMAPGPMTAVVLGRGARSPHSGARIALGHGLVETPLIILLFLGFGRLMDRPYVKPGFALAGAAILLFMAIGMLKAAQQPAVEAKDMKGGDIAAGAVISIGNPFFIIWWATIGMALIIRAADLGIWVFALFVFVHWSCDLVWFWFLSALSFKGGHFFGQKFQKILFTACGVFLIYIAFRFFRDGMVMLNV